MTSSLNLPGWAITTMRDLGFDAPNGKEGTMLDIGVAHVQHGTRSAQPPQVAVAATQELVSHNSSTAVDAAGKALNSPGSPAANLASASTGSKGIGVGAMSFAGITLGLKLSNIAQVGMLVAGTAEAVAEAPFTAGTSLLQVPVLRQVATRGINGAISTATNAVMGHH
jgi:hypothetical protein